MNRKILSLLFAVGVVVIVSGCIDTAQQFVENNAENQNSNVDDSSTFPDANTGEDASVLCIEDWSCLEWGSCESDGTQTRVCTDDNNCGTSDEKPTTSQNCVYSPEITGNCAPEMIEILNDPATPFCDEPLEDCYDTWSDHLKFDYPKGFATGNYFSEIDCWKGGNKAGENINYIYCYLISSCQEHIQNDVVQSFMKTRWLTSYDIIDTEMIQNEVTYDIDEYTADMIFRFFRDEIFTSYQESKLLAEDEWLYWINNNQDKLNEIPQYLADEIRDELNRFNEENPKYETKYQVTMNLNGCDVEVVKKDTNYECLMADW